MGLFDFFKARNKEAAYDPQQEDGKKRPIRARVAPADVMDKDSGYPSEGLTPKKLAAIYKEADAGNVKLQMELFEEIEEKDTHIASQLQTRKMAVKGLDWEIHEASDGNPLDKEIAGFVKSQIEKLFCQDEDVILNLLDAVGKGVSVSEIDWGVDCLGRNVIRQLRYIPPKKLLWDPITDEMLICTRNFPAGVQLPYNKFVVHRYQARSGHASKAGVLRSVSWMYLFKNYDIKDWVTFCEVYGMPIRLGKYPEAASEDDKVALMRALVSIGTDAAGIISSGSEIQIIEANKTASADIYERLARYCDEQNSKAIVGQTLTADSGGGSYAQGKVHGEVRHDLITADAVALAKTINRDIIRPLVYYNYGPVDPPAIEFDTKEDEDLQMAAEVYKVVISDIGLPVAEDHLYDKFNIPKPGVEEKLLQRPSQGGYAPVPASVAFKALKAAQEKDVDPQRMLDGMTEQALGLSGQMFQQILQPVLEMMDTVEDLQTLQLQLKDEKTLARLLEKMSEGTEMMEVLQQGIYLAEAIGQTRDV